MSTMGYRMLFAIAQCVDGNELFTELTFTKEAIFKYLGVSKSNKRYDILYESLDNVLKGGLSICSLSPRGKRLWTGMNWISHFEFSEDKSAVYISVNKCAIPYLCELKQYAIVQPKTYLKLTTDYQNWLYPLLKIRVGLGKWEISIDYIYESLDLDDDKSYNKKNKNWIFNILKRIIGIQISDKAKEEQRLATLEKRKPKMVAWDYTKNASGQPSGTLYTITKETDINVYATVVKEGRSYNKIIFFISEKDECMSAARKEDRHQRIMNEADMDMQLVKRHHAKKVKTEETPLTQLFDSMFPIPGKEVEQLKAEPIFYTDKDLECFINPECGMNTIADVADKAGYRKHPNGKWYKIQPA